MIVAALATAAVICGAVAVRLGLQPRTSGPPRSLRNLPLAERFVRRREDAAVARELPGLFEALARSLRSGLSVRAALGDARTSVTGPLESDLNKVVERIDAGGTVDEAMSRWAADRAGVEGIRLAAVAVSLAAGSGASVAAAVDGVADTLREQVSLHDEVAAMSAQARMSAGLIFALPIGFAAVATFTDPETLRFTVSTSTGRLCLVVGVGLDLAAFVWMRQMVRAIR